MTAVGNGAADLAPPRSNTGTVPDHAILGSLVGFSHSIGLLVDLIKASLFCFRFAFTLDTSDSVAGTDQSTAQVWTLPLVIKAIEMTVL